MKFSAKSKFGATSKFGAKPSFGAVAGFGTAGGGSGHRYWQIFIEQNSGNSRTNVNQIEMRGEVGGPDLTGSGTASASSEHTGVADDAFNDITTNGSIFQLATGANEFITYDFGSGVDIVEILWRTDGNITKAPAIWKMRYSDDGVTFTDAWDIRLDGDPLTPWTAYTDFVFQPRVPPAQKSVWRLLITEGFTSDTRTSVRELTFRETPGGPDVEVASGSFASDANANAVNAFDGNTSTTWLVSVVPQSGVPELWIANDMGQVRDITEFTWRTGNNTDQAFAEVEVQYNDGAGGWITEWTQTAALGNFSANTVHVFSKEGPAKPSSEVYSARADEFSYDPNTRALQTDVGITEISPALYGFPGAGFIKPNGSEYFNVGGLTGTNRHLAIAFRWRTAADALPVLLGGDNQFAFIGALADGNANDADDTPNISRGGARINTTDFAGAMTRDQVWDASDRANAGSNYDTIQFFAYEDPTRTVGDFFRPFYYPLDGFQGDIQIVGIAIYDDMADTEAWRAYLTHVPQNAGYRYWGIDITANNGGVTSSISRLDFKNSGGAILTPDTCFISSCFDTTPTRYPINAFDENDATFTTWAVASGTPGPGLASNRLMYDFGEGGDPNVASIDLRSVNDGSGPGLAPQDFTIFKSKDGVTLETVRTITGETGWSEFGETRNFLSSG